MIRLTLFEEDCDCFIDPSAIMAVVPLPAHQRDGHENGSRTRIDYGDRMMVLVRESPAEVMEKIR
jgi:hypothetical protein